MANPEFYRILCDVYRLDRYEDVPNSAIPFVQGLNPLFSKYAFSLPLGFYYTAEQLQKLYLTEKWPMLTEFSRSHDINLSICCVGQVKIEGGQHIANNPILRLSNNKNHLVTYKKNHIKNLKKEYNKANREDVEIQFTEDEQDLRAFYHILARQYVCEHNMVFQPYKLFQLLLIKGFGKLLIARRREKDILGGLILMPDGDILHYSWGARKHYKNLSVGTLLIDHAIRYAVNAGFGYFDFGSTPLSDLDLLEYKMKWGAEKFSVYKYTTLENKGVIDLHNSYILPRKCFSLMPVPVAKLIMPKVVPWLITG